LKEPIARFKQSVFRPNLFYDVKMKDTIGDVYEDLKLFALKALGGAAEPGEDWVSLNSHYSITKPMKFFCHCKNENK
jgi:hypothetical protein